MTYRNFGPELLNAGRARRQTSPAYQQKSDYASDFAPRNHAAGELNRELAAIAAELGRLKATQSTRAPEPQSFPNARQPAFDAAQLNAIVQSLKSDVRTQMRDDLDAQYVRLREELNGLNAAIAGTALQGSFKNEISELLSGLNLLASGNRSIQDSQDELSAYLQRELGELQSSLSGLARNDGFSKLDDRWNSLENRWNKLEGRLDSNINADTTSYLSEISNRLSSLHDKVNDGGLESLENRLLMLAKSVDALAHSRTTGANTAVDFSQIDKRFDELSRAVAAIGAERAAPPIDNQAVDQIEKAIGLLGRKLELIGNMAGQNPSIDAIEVRLGQLQDRFAELPDYLNQEPVMERIDRLAEKVSALPVSTLSPSSIDALTQQLNSLTGEIRGNAGMKPDSTGIFESLDDRLGSIEERLHSLVFSDRTPAPSDTDSVILALEQRFSELSAHLEAMQPAVAAPVQIDLSGLEQKLADISRQLAVTSEPNVSISSLDRLEGQIADLSQSLTAQPRSEPEALSERFASLESLLSQNQHALLESARKAAETAALQFKNTAGQEDNTQIVSVIAGELASLEQLTRSSNERSTSAIEGIFGALTKIAERLAALESAPVAPVAQVEKVAPRMQAATVPFAEETQFSPSLEVDESDLGNLHVAENHFSRKPRTPSEMAQAAANDALRGLDGKESTSNAPELRAAELDVPLSPGANIPDLNSILKRVREQKKATQNENAKDTDRKDYFSSIKRAAQAAAAEVQQIEPTAKSGSALGNVKSIYAKFRRPILMVAAAAIVAIAAIQLTGALMSSDAEVAAEVSSELPQNTLSGGTPEQTMKVEPLLSEPSAQAGLKEIDALAPAAVEPAGEAKPRVVEAKPEDEKLEEISKVEDIAVQPAETQITDLKPAGSDLPATALTSAELPKIPAKFGPASLIEAAQNSDVKAQFEIGRRLAENQSDPKKLADSFAWFNVAANQGFAPAQYRVGNMYEKGLGVERSASDAKLWYQMAAESGNASAMHNLAVLFASGADGTVDSASALRWFQKAADLGVGDSQFNLGVMMGKGQGVPQDLEESYKWLAILAKSGDVEAASKRDEVAKTMRPEQVASAKAKVELWKPQPAVTEANDLTIPEAWQIAGGATASVDVKKAVKNVQLILTKLGYKVGTPDGIMGENTRKAIRAFQKQENLAVSGEIDGPLVKALLAKNG